MLKAHSLRYLGMQHSIYIMAWQYWQHDKKKKKKKRNKKIVATSFFYLEHYLKSGNKVKYTRWLTVAIDLTQFTKMK